MDHLVLRFGRARVLIGQPQVSVTGRSVGYGTLVRVVEDMLLVGRAAGAAVFFIRPPKPMNEALFDLESAQVRIVSQRSRLAPLLRVCWFASTPFRLSGFLWWKRVLSRAVAPWTDRLLRVIGTSTARRRRFRKRVAAVAEWVRQADSAYASRAAADWRHTANTAKRLLSEAARRAPLDPLRIRLSGPREREAAEAARQLGISSGNRIVTLHVRESGYRTALGVRQRPFDNARDGRIETYLEAVDWLVAHGYIVVRIGDSTMRPARRPGLVDLATSPQRTERLELWCMIRSEFFIASDSGPYFLCRLTGVPSLVVNAVQCCYYTYGAKDRFICKLVVDRQTGHHLSVSEMLSEEHIRNGMNVNRYQHLDNSPQDILDAVREMADVVNGHESRSEAQRSYDERVASLARSWSPAWKGEFSLILRRKGDGTIARSFADRYYHAPCPSTVRASE